MICGRKLEVEAIKRPNSYRTGKRTLDLSTDIFHSINSYVLIYVTIHVCQTQRQMEFHP